MANSPSITRMTAQQAALVEQIGATADALVLKRIDPTIRRADRRDEEQALRTLIRHAMIECGVTAPQIRSRTQLFSLSRLSQLSRRDRKYGHVAGGR